MGDPRGFLKTARELPMRRQVDERLKDFKETEPSINLAISTGQASRCMDCGVPFCHNECPLGNLIPDFNEAVYQENWLEAFTILKSTNNFPEVTGRICPAPCESSCVLGINDNPVTIEYIEKSISDKAIEAGYYKSHVPKVRLHKSIAVIGSGPAGLACADQLNQAGYDVTVFERDERIGGLLRFGIPDFKLDKSVLDRRFELMKEEGVIFITSTTVGIDITAEQIEEQYDAIVLTGGATDPINIPIPGRDLSGVHFAMDYLGQSNRRVGHMPYLNEDILACEKNVIVIGGGDTGSDCIGTANRQGAKQVTQLEIMPMPPSERSDSTPWPTWPMMLRSSSSHEEGCERKWEVSTKKFIGNNGQLSGLELVDIQWVKNDEGKFSFQEIEGSSRIIPCELALIAIGYTISKNGLIQSFFPELEEYLSDEPFRTSKENIFIGGDMRRGQSLVVWAIDEGRRAAIEVDKYLNSCQDTH